jgi:tetratricopeptide (TPR) repeat protein
LVRQWGGAGWRRNAQNWFPGHRKVRFLATSGCRPSSSLGHGDAARTEDLIKEPPVKEDRFLSSEEYDEQAHRLYDDGDVDGALEMLREGLSLYPNAVELYVGLGYARLAREEYAWARQGFGRALTLDPLHEEALVGMGETILRLGETQRALELFREVQRLGFDEDVELMLTMGRALYREGLFAEAKEVFSKVVSVRPDSGDGIAALGYVLHRLGDEVGSSRHLRRALKLNPDLHEARVYLGHLLFDRGDWEAALREFERVAPGEHWDSLAVWRIIELKRSLWQMEEGDARLVPWEVRLGELQSDLDPVDQLLAEVEAKVNGSAFSPGGDLGQLELFTGRSTEEGGIQRAVRLPEGQLLRGTWLEIVRQMRDLAGFAHEPLPQYMKRLAERWHEQRGVEVPATDPRTFLLTAIRAGLLTLEEDSER